MIGKLRERVDLIAVQFDRNSVGDQVPCDRVEASVWAEIVQTAAGETNRANQVYPTTATRFRIRKRPGLSATKKLRHKAKVYEIIGTEDAGSHDGKIVLVAQCSN
jgi:head-tail adaptor